MKTIPKEKLGFFCGQIRKKSEKDYNYNKVHQIVVMPFNYDDISDNDSRWDELKDLAVDYLKEEGELPTFAENQDYERVDPCSISSFSSLLRKSNELSDVETEEVYEMKLFDNAFDKIVLPNGYKEKIIEVVSQLKDGKKIFEDWGLEEKIKKGRGVNLLFSGESGTGKTYCGEIIADYIGVNAEVVSVADIEDMYVGQSERNLRGIFKSLKGGNKVLIIDEADSFLTSRNSSKWNYENKLTNQFLIELERHNGICIMTTNRPVKLDKALARRIDVNLNFPFPNKEARKEIWKYIIPEKMPKGEVDYEKIAEIKISGGSIKNAILSCARRMVTNKIEKLDTELMLSVANEELEEITNEELKKDFS